MKHFSLLTIAASVAVVIVAAINYTHGGTLRQLLTDLSYGIGALGLGSALWTWGHPKQPLAPPYNQPTGQIAQKHNKAHSANHGKAA